MRMMWCESGAVEEYTSIDYTVCYPSESDKYHGRFIVELHQPEYFLVDDEEKDFFEAYGWYQLDGTKETFDKAMENYNKVTTKLLKDGYCLSTDFENFEWY